MSKFPRSSKEIYERFGHKMRLEEYIKKCVLQCKEIGATFLELDIGITYTHERILIIDSESLNRIKIKISL
jgi:hypothetical protein